jgi:hypothetical protein
MGFRYYWAFLLAGLFAPTCLLERRVWTKAR